MPNCRHLYSLLFIVFIVNFSEKIVIPIHRNHLLIFFTTFAIDFFRQIYPMLML